MLKKFFTKRIVRLGIAVVACHSFLPVASYAQQDKYDALWEIQSKNGWTKEQKIEALSGLWMYAKFNFVYMDKVGHERWDSLYRSLITPALETKNDMEFSNLMNRFCAFLNDEHTYIRLQKIFQYTTNYFSDNWFLSTELIDGRVIVTGVSKEKEALVPLGSEIISHNGLPIAQALAERGKRISASTEAVRMNKAGRQLLGDSKYATQVVEFRQPKGQVVKVTLHNEFGENYGSLEKTSLPDILGYDDFRLDWYPDDVAYVKIGTFMKGRGVEQGLEKALPELKARAKKLIIDLRNNGGGNSGFAGEIAGHFIADTIASDGKWYTPTHNAAYASWGAGLQPKDTVDNESNRKNYLNYNMLAIEYGGSNSFVYPQDYTRIVVPTIILTNTNTCSASENFLVIMDGRKHIQRMGEATSGSTGNPVRYDLIPGIVCAVCTKKDVYPDGREFVGKGIQPDILMKETLGDRLAGKDAVLEAALKRMGSKIKKKK